MHLSIFQDKSEKRTREGIFLKTVLSKYVAISLFYCYFEEKDC